jgi:hypothetical protein
MNSNAKPPLEKLGPFSSNEVKALVIALSLGAALGVAVEMVDAILPKEHKMSAIAQRIIEGRDVNKKRPKKSFDIDRPGAAFPVTE